MKSKEYPYAILEYLDHENLLFYRVKQDITVDEDVMKEMLIYVEEFMGEKKHRAIVDFGSNVHSTTEGRALYAKSDYINRNRIADAFIVNSLAMRLIANFFIQVTKPKVPTHLFNDEEKAINWLKKFSKN